MSLKEIYVVLPDKLWGGRGGGGGVYLLVLKNGLGNPDVYIFFLYFKYDDFLDNLKSLCFVSLKVLEYLFFLKSKNTVSFYMKLWKNHI